MTGIIGNRLALGGGTVAPFGEYVMPLPPEGGTPNLRTSDRFNCRRPWLYAGVMCPDWESRGLAGERHVLSGWHGKGGAGEPGDR